MNEYANGAAALIFAAIHSFAAGPPTWETLLTYAVAWLVTGTLLSRKRDDD